MLYLITNEKKRKGKKEGEQNEWKSNEKMKEKKDLSLEEFINGSLPS